MQKIMVVGAGQMGAGIAQVAAQSGLQVLLVDSFKGATTKAREGMEKSLAKLFEKKQLSESVEAVLKRLTFSESLQDGTGFQPDIVLEAITENFEAKAKIFRELDGLLEPKVVFSSNTSSISITQLAAVTKRPKQFIGMHFMNPVPLMQLVEIIRGLQTSQECYDAVSALAKQMKKTTILSQDRAGFIINRILMPMINEAALALGEGLATKEDIDTGMKLGTNQPMGPLALADFIGLDTCLSIMEVLYGEFADSKYRPAPLLKQYVRAGLLGKKSGQGFYSYKSA